MDEDALREEVADHIKVHEQERTVAKETAQRLEREVEQTAQRLERVVEETALRLEKGVQTALTAVAETAKVHSEAHNREHVAHERIHTVEKVQVDKAEQAQREKDKVNAEALAEYKKANNEWGSTVRELTAQYPQRNEIESKFANFEKDIKVNADAIRELRETVITQFSSQGGRTEGVSSTAKAAYSAIAAIALLLGIAATVIAIASRGG